MSELRIGHGYDVHAFKPGDHIMLGGVRIPYSKAFLAHSDGDVLIHAVCDALLGAAALGDIGQHFPDTDDCFKDADSRELLRSVIAMIRTYQFSVNNLDATIIAQSPKMAPHIQSMRENLAADMQIDIDRVNVKATTTEKLGFTGREEGVAVHAVTIIQRS
jgi:2-C-methyl-D-erythritol 2,4-cyclodiphosphate synthase